MTIKEINLFKAVDLWATKECERQQLTVDGAAKRRVLGESLIKALPFPTMEQEDFASVVLDSKILTLDEIVSIIKCLSAVSSSPVIFPERKRCGLIHRCNRFGIPSHGWGYGASKDAICCSVDKDIVLHGVCLFGSENNTYSVDLEVVDYNAKFVLMSECGEFYSEKFQDKKYSYFGFKVPFAGMKGVILKKNRKYDIRAKITGSISQSGEGGVSTVHCSGVTFTFMRSEYSNNGTGVDRSQFPELMFSLY